MYELTFTVMPLAAKHRCYKCSVKAPSGCATVQVNLFSFLSFATSYWFPHTAKHCPRPLLFKIPRHIHLQAGGQQCHALLIHHRFLRHK